MKSLLILGGSSLQVPAIQKAMDMGIYTIVLDGNSEVPGAKMGNEFFQTSTMDYEQVLKISKEKKIDGIITIASDQPMKVISKVGEELNLQTVSLETAMNCTDKGLMRSVLKENNVNIPDYSIASNFQEFNEIYSRFQLPFIVKPVNSSGSRGVQLVKVLTKLEEIYNYSAQYSSTKQVIIEEYIKGDEYSVETMTYKGKTNVIAITQKSTSGAPFFVEIQHMIPALVSKENRNKIEKIVVDTINAVGIKNGPSHCEVKLNNNEAYIIEIGARLGGDFISTKLVPLATGYDLVANTINIALGLELNVYKQIKKASLIKYLYTKTDSIYLGISNIDILKESRFFYEYNIYIEKNERTLKLRSSKDRIGHYILRGSDSQELLEEVLRINDNLQVKIEGVLEND